MARKKFTIEDAFLQLETIVTKLEQEETTLSDSLALYTEGMKLVKKCQDSLDTVEKELIILDKEEEG